MSIILQLLLLLNAYRSDAGRQPLAPSPLLHTVAQQRCEQQAVQGFISHAGLPWGVGENLAAGYISPDDVMNAWHLSSGHAANMVSTSYREIGLAVCYGEPWGVYWVQIFGVGDRPRFKQAWVEVTRE